MLQSALNKTLNLSNKNFLPLFFSLLFIGILAVTSWIIKKSGYHLIFAATASMPQGFYLVIPIKKISRQDIVEFLPPPSFLDFAKKNRWLPQSGSIIKQVFAIPDDHVCINNQQILINGEEIGTVAKFYAKNKPLPRTNFCGKLGKDQYLLLSTKSERSFDSRYFGPVPRARILGQAVPLFQN